MSIFQKSFQASVLFIFFEGRIITPGKEKNFLELAHEILRRVCKGGIFFFFVLECQRKFYSPFPPTASQTIILGALDPATPTTTKTAAATARTTFRWSWFDRQAEKSCPVREWQWRKGTTGGCWKGRPLPTPLETRLWGKWEEQKWKWKSWQQRSSCHSRSCRRGTEALNSKKKIFTLDALSQETNEPKDIFLFIYFLFTIFLVFGREEY